MSPGAAPSATVNGDVSFWWRQLGGLPAPRPSLTGPVEADVCIIGAGYTGLWTAYYLKRAQPDLRVVVLEARFAGYGASGRNGGWLVNSVTGGREQYVASHGRAAAAAQQAALTGAVREVVDVAQREGIEADIDLGGELVVARSPAQLERLREAVEADAAWPGTDVELLDAGRAAGRVRVAGALGASWQPHCARVHPAKLVAGLAAAVERLGVEVFEDTPVRAVEPGRAVTDRGAVRAPYVIRATEGYTAGLRGERRTLLPMNSSMIVTEPLPASAWAEIGWAGNETLGDMAHAYVYAQRTADGRIALGGRGVPYRFGSRTDDDGRTQPGTVEALTGMLHELFPAAAGASVHHAWCGVLGVPRDWSASVGLDHATGLGWAGGYVGTGVAATNLAGRTLAHLVLERDSDLTRLPWVGHGARRWEPEPLRWLGVHALYRAYRAADRRESAGLPTTSRLARVADRVAGR